LPDKSGGYFKCVKSHNLLPPIVFALIHGNHWTNCV
jgi:hypothetical protein